MGLGNWIVIPFITLVPSLVVPLWLSPMLGVPYGVLVSSLLVGQGISAVVSFFIVNGLSRFSHMIMGTAPVAVDSEIDLQGEVPSYGKR